MKTGDDVKPLLSSGDTLSLKEGDVFEGEVVRSLPENKVMVSFRDQTLTAKTNLTLNPGDQIRVEVQSTKGEIVLKVLDRKPSLETLLRQEMKPLMGSLQRSIDKTVLNLKTTIQAFLASQAVPEDEEIFPLLTRLSALLDRFNLTPLVSDNESEGGSHDFPVTPNVRSSIEVSAAESFPEEGFSVMKADSLMEWIKGSGIEWESKLRALVESSPKDVASTVKSLLQNDLKGLTLKVMNMLSNLEEAGQKETGRTVPQNLNHNGLSETSTIQGRKLRQTPSLPKSFSPPSTSSPSTISSLSPSLLPELSQHLEQLAQTIQAHQWINAIRQDSGQQFYFQIPLALSDGVKPLDLFIYKQKQKKQPKRSEPYEEKGGYWVVFFLTLSILGPLRIDLRTREKSLTLSIQTETDAAQRRISPFLSGLERALKNVGYSVAGLKVEKASGGKVQRPNPISDLPFISNGVISIVA